MASAACVWALRWRWIALPRRNDRDVTRSAPAAIGTFVNSSIAGECQQHQQQQQHDGEESDGRIIKSCNKRTCSLASCHAYEISLYANATYRHNFHAVSAPNKSKSSNNGTQNGFSNTHTRPSPSLFTVTTKLIEHLKPSDVDGRADMWTMSPPCQPFTGTTNSKKLDGQDKRTAGFRAVMTLLSAIRTKPKYILLENVKGFVGSQMLDRFYDCLESNGYSWEEYLLTPMQLGIPNHRKRYYLIAERSDRFIKSDGEKTRGDILDTVPCSIEGGCVKRPLSHYIDCSTSREEGQAEDQYDHYVIPDDILAKPWAKSLPIVSAHDTLSHCFTAAYGRVVHQATGSLLLIDLVHPAVERCPLDRTDMMKYSGRLRKFTPKELLAVFGYPGGFEFPADISLEHRYKLIGNSVNCLVVSSVAEELLGTWGRY